MIRANPMPPLLECEQLQHRVRVMPPLFPEDTNLAITLMLVCWTAHKRHFVRHRYDDGISLICSIQHMSCTKSMMGLTLTAQAIASPIPVGIVRKEDLYIL